MCTIKECNNSFAVLCNWIRELINLIKELSNTANMSAKWKNVWIRELSNSITELSNLIKELSKSKDKLN